MPDANWYSRNKEKARAANKEWREKNREYDKQRKRNWYHTVGRGRDLDKKYGLTVDEYDKMFAEQGGLCALCPSDYKLSVDHNHDTGEVRGILCYDCNRNFIGNHTDPSKYRRAADYLEGKREKVV
jgi:hypothetical protein